MTFKNIRLFNYFVYNQFGGARNNEAKWSTFSHNGVLFPDPYEIHGIPLIYDGKEIILDPESEEYATIYAKFIDTDYIKSSTFRKNFFNDWKVYLKKNKFIEIIDLDKCDFTKIYNHLLNVKEHKKNISKEEKEIQKQQRDKYENDYKIAHVDGKEQVVGNFRIEPPGIFLGRGCHPKAGKLKKRIYPEDITINIDKHSPKPPLPPFYKNHKWKKIIHDNTIEWIASWKDDITGKIKYVWLGAKSDFKAKSDLHKFETARKLKKSILEIRTSNYNNIISNSTDNKTKQLACALYLIDNLALRVGNEKGEDEADTVGVCSLRIEHIELKDDYILKLDFLGKDSIRYVNTITIDENVYNCISRFIKNKKKDDDLFDLINTNLLNSYLKSMMSELTAKVFRTFNASNLFQNEINKINDKINDKNNNIPEDNKINIILDMYNKANIKVALLCNHQKGVSKTFNEQIKKIDTNYENILNRKNELLKEKEELELNKEKNKEKIKKINEKIKKNQLKLTQIKNKKHIKLELKNLSLTTSKINYIDPRITIVFLKKHNLPLEKIFSATLIDKFFWAMDVDIDFQF